MLLSKKFKSKYEDLNKILLEQDKEIIDFCVAFSKLLKAKSFNKSKLFVLGNGGLYSEADHFCAELT